MAREHKPVNHDPYTMEDLLQQREQAQRILDHANNGGWPREIEMAKADLVMIEADIEVKTNEMADDVEALLDQTDERPYDWKEDGE
jgi:hypothetical protein